eukprot:6194942-Pleurochrysis_carterae.AAC.1
MSICAFKPLRMLYHQAGKYTGRSIKARRNENVNCTWGLLRLISAVGNGLHTMSDSVPMLE